MPKYNGKISLLDKYLVWIIAIGPLFTQYVSLFDFILLPEIFIIPILPIFIIKKNRINTRIFKPLIIYLYVVVLLTLLVILLQQNISISTSATAFARFLFYVLIILFISSSRFNIDYGSKVIVAIATLNSIYGILQYTVYALYGKVLPWHIAFLKVKYGTKLIEEYNYYFSQFGYRFSGMFSEPAHFSQYLSFALLIVLFYKSEKFNIKKANKIVLVNLYSFVMILNGSGTGFVMLLFCLSILAMKSIVSKNRNMADILIKSFVITMIIIVIIFIVNSTVFNSGYTRVSNFSELSATNIRIFRPLLTYYDLPFINKLIGVGYANYSTYVFNSGIATSYELAVNSAWTNTIGYILVGSGLIGFIAYSLFYIHLIRLTNGFYRYLVFMLFVFAFFTEVPLSFQFVTIMSYIIQGILHTSISSNLLIRPVRQRYISNKLNTTTQNCFIKVNDLI